MLLVALNVIPHLRMAKDILGHCTEPPLYLLSLPFTTFLHHTLSPLTHLPLARQIHLHAMSPGV